MGWTPLRARRDRRDEELAALEAYRLARRLVGEDLSAFGEAVDSVSTDALPPEVASDHRVAAGRYVQVRSALAAATTVAEVAALEAILDDGRIHLACVLAAVEGREWPTRREPCFFDARHGPATADLPWTPPGEPERSVGEPRRPHGPPRGRGTPGVRPVATAPPAALKAAG